MPVDLPAEIDRIKNVLDTKSAWLWLLAITITGVSEVLRWVNNNENVIYGGNVYTKCNFTLGPWERTSPGEIPRRTLSITNADLAEYMLPYVEDYDGAVGAVIVATPVNSYHLDVDMSSRAQEYQITRTSPAEKWIAFILGAPNPLLQRFPRDIYGAVYCRFLRYFKEVGCGYAGEGTCNGTYISCKALNNETRFGAELGLRSKTVRFA